MAFENTPNTVMEDTVNFGDEQVSILTSYDSNMLAGGGDEGFGVGSLKPRSIAAKMALYKPYNTSFDTIVQLMGGFDVATKYVHEYTEDDELWADEAPAHEPTFDNTKVIHNVDGGAANPYDPATSDVYYILSNEDAGIFKPGDTCRYGNSNGEYQYAVIEKIGTVTDLIEGGYGDNDKSKALQLRSIDYDGDRSAQPLEAADSVDTVLERMFSVRGSDLSFPVQARGTVPKMYKTYLQTAALDTGYTLRGARDESYINQIARKQMKLMNELKRGRDLLYMYSKGGKFDIPADVDLGTEGDKAYLADGIWEQINSYNNVAFDSTDADTIRASLRTLIEQNFGGESGGPEIRQVFGSAKYMSDVEFAYEDQRRYYSTEYIAGVRVMRYESALGLVDFIWNPMFEYKHPIPGGSVRSGSGKAVGIMLSVPDNITRLEYIGEGPRLSSFMEKGGQKEEFMRVEMSAGVILNLPQYTCAHVE